MAGNRSLGPADDLDCDFAEPAGNGGNWLRCSGRWL